MGGMTVWWKRKAKGSATNVIPLERRAFERISITLILICRREGGGEDFKVHTDNVCLQGVKAVTNEALFEGEILDLYVVLYSVHTNFRVKGRVVWVKSLGAQQYEGGIEFLNQDAADRQKWEQFIHRYRV